MTPSKRKTQVTIDTGPLDELMIRVANRLLWFGAGFGVASIGFLWGWL